MRAIVEMLLKMNVILKEKNSTLKDKSQSINTNIELCKTKIEQQSKYIRDIAALTSENKKKYEKQIQSAELKIQKLQDHNNELSNELETVGDIDLTELQTKKNNVIATKAEKKQELKAVAKRGLFLENNDECPTCEQPIQHKDKLVSETKTEALQIESKLSGIENDYKDIK